MAIFIIKQKHDVSNKKKVIDIHKNAKKHRILLKISLFFNIMLITYIGYLKFK